MLRLFTAACVAAGLAAAAGNADAQIVTYYSPVVPAPPVYAPPAYAPPVYTPPVYTSVAPTVVYRPVATPLPTPVVTTVARPVYAAPALAPTAVVTTRYRPLLGRSVSRVRYRYTPVTVYGY